MSAPVNRDDSTRVGSPLTPLSGVVALLLLVFTPLNSKIAGTLWGLGFIFSIAIAWSRRPWDPADSVDHAARVWLVCTLVAFSCWASVMAIAGELFVPRSAELNTGARLFTGAIAALCLVRTMRKPGSRDALEWVVVAIALACVVSLFIPLSRGRDEGYPTNPIPWAGAIAIFTALAASWCFDQSLPPKLVF